VKEHEEVALHRRDCRGEAPVIRFEQFGKNGVNHV
jgi:hypothetical protein